MSGPNDQNCCEGIEAITPLPIENRPGLSALFYRVGTHAAFFETMLAGLSTHVFPDGQRPLLDLRTRRRDDPAIALLDAWALVGDVLTFYQERIANEGYLRTASERRSILELGNLVSYQLRPGVAASVYLAFTVTTDFDTTQPIPVGTQAKSLPIGDQLPQVFETAEPLLAKLEWNVLRPRLTRPPNLTLDRARDIPEMQVRGVETGLQANDWIMISSDNDAVALRQVEAVEADANANVTRVSLVTPLDTTEADALIVARRAVENAIQRFAGDETVTAREAILPALANFRESVTSPEARRIGLNDLVTIRANLPNNATRLRRELDATVEALSTAFTDLPSTAVTERRTLNLEQLRSNDGEVSIASVLGDQFAPIRYLLGLPDLTKPPSVPPRNRAALKLSLGQTLQGDTSLQILKKVYGGGTLPYVAVFNQVNQPQPPLRIFKVIRALPFANSAPQHTSAHITNDHSGDQTSEIQYDEWDLGDGIHRIDANRLYLDAEYTLRPNSRIVIDRPPTEATTITVDTRAAAVANVGVSSYGMTGRVTRITLPPGGEWLVTDDLETVPDDFDVIRQSQIYIQDAELEWADIPTEQALALEQNPAAFVVENDTIELDQVSEDLQAGHWLIVAGERIIADEANSTPITVAAAELVMLTSAEQAINTFDWAGRVRTRLNLSPPLAYRYVPNTVTIYANVVKATHGESYENPIGSGDASRRFQSFPLPKKPLTYTAAPTTDGIESTLEVFVDNVRWHETERLTQLGATVHGYSVQTDNDDTTTVITGDGVFGARVPTGDENVVAKLRSGIGQPGNVPAEAISQLINQPLGVREVINPRSASGGADRETRDQARRNVPIAVRALDRLVSVSDYADFSRKFAGIAKAHSNKFVQGQRSIVHVTIAGQDDIPINPESDLLGSLQESLRRYGDPQMPVSVGTRSLKALILEADIVRHPDYRWDDLETRLRAALTTHFSFDERDLGQDVPLSEVISVMQQVEGVTYVDVNIFSYIPEFVANDEEALQKTLTQLATIVYAAQANRPEFAQMNRVRAYQARYDPATRQITPAELAYFLPNVPDMIILRERTV